MVLFLVGSEGSKIDEVTMMLAIGIFVLHAPPEVVSAPNVSYPCMNHFRQCLQSSCPIVCNFYLLQYKTNIKEGRKHVLYFLVFQVQIKCIQTLKTIFSHNDHTTAVPYINALAPRLIELLHMENTSRLTEQQLNVTVETVATVECLLSFVESKHCTYSEVNK